jgi:5-methylcytosine-specific restriction endonuclease McrA
MRQARLLNLDYHRERVRRWRKDNKEKARNGTRKGQVLRRSARGRALLSVTSAQLKERLGLFGMNCAYCGSNEKISVDHVLPIKMGGLDEISNIVPACHKCNCSKGAKPVREWYRSQPFFSNRRWRKLLKTVPEACSLQLSLSAAGPMR